MLQTLKRFAKQQIVARNNYKLVGVPRIEAERAERHGARRLNIVLLAIGKESLFGGAATALRLFRQLGTGFERLRIIVILEDERKFVQADWPDWSLGEGRDAANTVVYTRSRTSRLRVEDGDVFIATHWMTCLAVRQAQSVQPASSPQNYVYLIQDFEPGFYPWSGRYLLAQGTYIQSRNAIAVFNTIELYNYFSRLGFEFAHHYVFEPALNPSLAKYRDALIGRSKRRLLLVYGRPGTPRNAFDVIVESLEIWARRFDGAARWEVVSLGENHRKIRLSPAVSLRSGGKVSLEQYATYLSDAAVGFSLMVSPHPSYPPLEMASFGARVVSNSFIDKNLELRSPMIKCLDETLPACFADALVEACRAFEANQHPIGALPPPAFRGSDDEFPFLDEVRNLLSR